MDKQALKHLLYELDNALVSAELGFTNLNAIMDNLHHYTNDHAFINEVTHCPWMCIFNAVKKMREETDKAFDAMRSGGGCNAHHE